MALKWAESGILLLFTIFGTIVRPNPRGEGHPLPTPTFLGAPRRLASASTWIYLFTDNREAHAHSLCKQIAETTHFGAWGPGVGPNADKNIISTFHWL